MENENKYMEYKKMCDYHHDQCDYYKGKSKTMYKKHYKYYKYYYAKMTSYAKKSGHDHGYDKECDTHTHYKHYYHHHHIDKHHYYCDDSSSSSSSSSSYSGYKHKGK